MFIYVYVPIPKNGDPRECANKVNCIYIVHTRAWPHPRTHARTHKISKTSAKEQVSLLRPQSRIPQCGINPMWFSVQSLMSPRSNIHQMKVPCPFAVCPCQHVSARTKKFPSHARTANTWIDNMHHKMTVNYLVNINDNTSFWFVQINHIPKSLSDWASHIVGKKITFQKHTTPNEYTKNYIRTIKYKLHALGRFLSLPEAIQNNES